MAQFSAAFKQQAVEKALSRGPDETLKILAEKLGVSLSALKKWIRLAKSQQLEPIENNMKQEKSPQDWTREERLEAVIHCGGLKEAEIGAYCRTQGVYPHPVKVWKLAFVGGEKASSSRREHKRLKEDNRRLQKELRRKDKALSETAALWVLSKKCEAIWGGNADD